MISVALYNLPSLTALLNIPRRHSAIPRIGQNLGASNVYGEHRAYPKVSPDSTEVFYP
jgi:hypothetical protein